MRTSLPRTISFALTLPLFAAILGISECAPAEDADGDGYTTAQGDCDDGNATVYPGALEVLCDDIDNNCDGQIDEGSEYPGSSWDDDNDGVTRGCGDCNDIDPTIYPGAYESCDGKDSNCNAVDGDGDGFLRDDGCDSLTYPYSSLGNSSYGPLPWDCDDTHATVYPGAPYNTDAFDYDCDGVVGCAEGGC